MQNAPHTSISQLSQQIFVSARNVPQIVTKRTKRCTRTVVSLLSDSGARIIAKYFQHFI
jgi:hypothetical protein